MAKISFQQIPAELDELFKKVISPSDTYWNSRAVSKKRLLSKPRLRRITQRSIMPQTKLDWAELPEGAQDEWKVAGQQQSYSSWSTYLQEKAFALKAGVEQEPIPRLSRQGKVGYIIINNPDTEILLEQPHPFIYYKYRKVRGTKSKYEKQRTTEIVALPMTVAVSYKSDLEAVEGSTNTELYALLLSEYQGRTIITKVSIPFELQRGWNRAETTISDVRGRIRAYNLYIHLQGVEGTLEFDNVKVEHTGHNWARDKRCNAVDREFTRQWYNVPAHWADIIRGDASAYYSTYHFSGNEAYFGDIQYGDCFYGGVIE